jgi:HAE1 family hydrophobic/amphiphilic exporter-1
MNLTALSIRRPSLIIVVFAVLTFMGVASYFNLPIELVPKFDPPVITIMTAYPGASPAEVENAVAKPIEDAISSLEGIEQIQIGSNENVCFVAVEIDQETDIDKTVQEMQRKINQILPTFPKEVRAPVINKFALSELPILRLAVRADVAGAEFYDLVSNRVVPEIVPGEGGGPGEYFGGRRARDQDQYQQRPASNNTGLSLLQVAQAVQRPPTSIFPPAR